MNIVISAYSFFPYIGGIETFTDVLATAFSELGHRVTIVTPVASTLEDRPTPYRIVRKPSFFHYLEIVEGCDVFYQSNISLRLAWPLLLVPKPIFVTHHSWPEETLNAKTRLRDRIRSYRQRLCIAFKNTCKALFCSLGHTIAISPCMQNCFGQKAHIIPNPYNDQLFYVRSSIPRSKDLIFVGRLVEEKGLQCALEALKILKDQGYQPHLSVVGQGPEREYLENLTHAYGLQKTVSFLGPLAGEALAEGYCQHAIQLIPSIFPEPFGLVALEGIACGCVPIGSEQGGLKNALGPCGPTFENGNAKALASHIRDLLDHPEKQSHYRSQAKVHLAQFSRARIAQQYMDFFISQAEL